MSRITTFIDTLLDGPTAASLCKVAAVVAAYVVGLAGWYRMWAEAWGAADALLAVRQGAGMAVLLLLLLVGLTALLGVLMEVSGAERAGHVLARCIAFVLGGSLWLAFVGLMHAVWLVAERAAM
jgi:hypothetical protein